MTTDFSFSDSDISQLSKHGISLAEATRQINLLLSPPNYIPLQRACTIGDGIVAIEENLHQELLSLHQEASTSGRLLKFVPASGAASRMFRDLAVFKNHKNKDYSDISNEANSGNKEAAFLIKFLANIEKFAIHNNLQNHLLKKNLHLSDLLASGNFLSILHEFLDTEGLGYLELPKGLIEFHKYKDHARTPFEEHIVEASETICDQRKICRLHFTVSPEHQKRFEQHLSEKLSKYKKLTSCSFEISFSNQKSSTDMLALGPNKQPFHDKKGHLLLRPGGHGALIENLNDIQGDIILIKNIDNIQPDTQRDKTILYKKLLTGYLLKIRTEIFAHLLTLHSTTLNEHDLTNILAFTRKTLCIAISDNKWKELDSIQSKRDLLIRKLNRPFRVCGVVKNTGEPGGGPFWVEAEDGTLSLQIVEGAQINHSSPTQDKIFLTSTHFNPVDLVCSVRNFKGEIFDLRKYVDQKAVILTHKSYMGQDLTVCERPGLWNGGMSDWITLFVEVPEDTFSPVKTINDLLRPSHLV
jgi:Domain of unknown function (DUF4301)